MSVYDEWYDDVPVDVSGLDGELFDPPVSPLDSSRFPSRNGGLPIDPDLAAILAGEGGLATKPGVFGIVEGIAEDLRTFIIAIVDTLGGDLGAIPRWIDDHLNLDWLPDLTGWLPAFLDFGQLLEALQGKYAGTDPVLKAIQTVTSPIRGALDLLSGVIPIGLLAPTAPNLLANGAFDGAVSMTAGDGWVWDDAVGRDKPGSARFDAAGVAGVQLSEPVQVAEGQKVAAEVWVKWAGVSTASASGFRLTRRWYSGETLISSSDAGSILDPAASGGWVKVSGEQTTPAGVDSVCLALTVDAGVTSGQVWWDDASLRKPTTSLPQQWIAGLVDGLADLWTGVEDAVDWVRELIAKLIGRPVGAIQDAIQDALTWVGQLGSILSGNSPSGPLPSLAGAVVGTIQTMINQFAAIANGDLVTPVNAIVQMFKDGWTGAAATAKSLTEQVADNINAAISGGVSTGVGIVKDVFDTIASIFGLAGTARDIAMSAQTQLQEITNNQTPEGFDGYSWSTIFSGSNGAALPAGDWPVVAGLAIRGDQGHVGIADGAANGHWHARAAGLFLSDTQSTSVVLGPRGKYGQDWDTGLYVRCDDAMTVGAFARVRSNRIDIGRFTRSGTSWNHFQFTQIATTVREGDLVRFRANGDTYYVLVNGIVKASYTDGTASVAQGTGYRRAGFSEQRSEYYSFPFTYRDDSYRVAAFAMADWLPPGASVTSPGWRLRRGSGNEVGLAVNHGEQAPMPGGFYNVNDLSALVTVQDLGTGQIKIDTAGWYEISATGIHRDNEAFTSNTYATGVAHVANAWHASPWVLYVDGAAVAGPMMAGVSTTIYLAEGQVVRPGVSASTPIQPSAIVVDVDGSRTSNNNKMIQARSRITGVSGAPSASFTGRKVG
ncbi:hypothetical protein [Gordonia sp. (in: high G+C Gram-positive bacteria)]|uniref:hypothetical protein n=1 Tax=Gordonia sp. (in: high G+C Gram-positive bacteria) TaxID=84139 RepID=UPI003C7351BA